MTASLFQSEVAKYEVAPWPERVFGGHYPRSARPEDRRPIPPAYATELQAVFNALNDMKQPHVEWDCGTTGIGVLVSDSLMFQRGQPTPSDPHLGNFYGLAMPLLKLGLPVTPVQLENAGISRYLDGFRILLLSYDGQKPLSPEVHAPLVDWIKRGGVLVFCDRDADPYLKVHEWWNSGGKNYATPREHLFELLGLDKSIAAEQFNRVGKGGLIWLFQRPVEFSASAQGAERVVAAAELAARKIGLKWRETNYLLLRRGQYLIAAGLDESIEGKPRLLHGRFVNLFDSELRVQNDISIAPGSRWFLLDLDAVRNGRPRLLASACKALLKAQKDDQISFVVQGVGETPAIMLLESGKAPRAVTLDGKTVTTFEHSTKERLLWIRFENEATPRERMCKRHGSRLPGYWSFNIGPVDFGLRFYHE